MSVNKALLIGNLGNDPEIKQFSNGGMVANVSIATTEKWVDKQTGERKEATEWHRVTFNNRLAEIAQQYLRKGSKVYVEGSIRTRKWQDQSGQDRYSTEIKAMSMQMLDTQQGQQSNGFSQPAQRAPQQQQPVQQQQQQQQQPVQQNNGQNWQSQTSFQAKPKDYKQNVPQNVSPNEFNQDVPADDDIPF